MSPFPPHQKRTPRRAGALLAAGVLLLGGQAAAQQVPELRGTTTQAAVGDELLLGLIDPAPGSEPGNAGAGLDAQRYRPISPGAIADEPPPDGDDPEMSSPFDDAVSAGTGERRQASRSGSDAGTPETTAAPVQSGEEAARDELTTGTARGGRAERENRRASAIGDPDRASENDPYAPLGIRAGSFVLTPRLDQGIGWTSNASSAPGGEPAVFSETRLRLEAISDWSSHSAAIEADGLYRKSLSGGELDELEGSIAGELRLDLSGGFSATATGGYAIEPESASSPVEIVGAASRPVRQTLSGGLELARDLGRLRLAIGGDVERDIYGDAELESGGVLSQEDRNSTLATVTLRGGYEVSPALRPFVEAEIGRRVYDLETDSAGFRRSADRYGARAGLEFDLGEKFRGEFSAGWLAEQPDDARLEPVSGLSVEGQVEWSPARGTVVGLTASTEVEGAAAAGQSGSILYSGSLAAMRRMRSNLTGEASVGLDWRDYADAGGHDLVLRGEVGLTWWLNRNLGLSGRASHETQMSTLPDRDYGASGVYLGLTLQR